MYFVVVVLVILAKENQCSNGWPFLVAMLLVILMIGSRMDGLAKRLK